MSEIDGFLKGVYIKSLALRAGLWLSVVIPSSIIVMFLLRIAQWFSLFNVFIASSNYDYINILLVLDIVWIWLLFGRFGREDEQRHLTLTKRWEQAIMSTTEFILIVLSLLFIGFLIPQNTFVHGMHYSQLLCLQAFTARIVVYQFDWNSVNLSHNKDVPLNILSAVKISFIYGSSRKSFFNMANNVSVSVLCYIATSLLPTTYKPNLSLWTFVTSTLLSHIVTYFFITPAAAALIAILYHPMDFQKLSEGKSDYVSVAVLDGPFKPPIDIKSLLPLSSMPSSSVHELISGSDFSHPLWYRLQLSLRNVSDNSLDSISLSDIGRPIISQLKPLPSYAARLIRTLSLQDLSRIARSSKLRRRKLFEDKKWLEIGYSLISFIDAATLQIQLDNAFMNVEVVNPPVSNQTSLLMLLAQNNSASRKEEKTERCISEASHIPLEIVKERKVQRDKTVYGLLFNSLHGFLSSLKQVSSAPLLSQVERVIDSIFDIGAVFDPLSSETVLNLVHAIESITAIIVISSEEDLTGLTLQYLPSALFSLLALEAALVEYGKTLRDVMTIQRGRYLGHYRHQKSLSKSFVTADILALSAAVDEGLNRLISSFYDMIPRYPCPSLYESSLTSRLSSCWQYRN